MERLMSIEPRISLQFIREMSHADAVRLCRTNSQFRRMCSKPEAREIIREKEARESFVIFGTEVLFAREGYGVNWDVNWNGAKVYPLRYAPRAVVKLEGASDEYSSMIFERVRGIYRVPMHTVSPWPSPRLVEECMRDPRLTLSYTWEVTDHDSTHGIGETCGFADGSTGFADLLNVHNFRVKQWADMTRMHFTVELSWERWNRYWRRGISRKIRAYGRYSKQEEAIFRRLWRD